MRIEIGGPLATKNIKTRTGDQLTLYSQMCYLHMDGARYPVGFHLRLDGPESAGRLGEFYKFPFEAFQTDEYQNLKVGDINLLACEKVQPPKAA